MNHQTSFVNVSVCKSNIKSKKDTFFARVCKTGRVQSEELLSRVKKAAPYIDINMMRAGMEKMIDIIVELTTSGKDVDFFNLGTFSLACEGAIKIDPAMQSYVEDGRSEGENADFDVSKAVKKEPNFALKFEPSVACKKTYRACKMALAVKKRRAPVIEKIENAVPKAKEKSCSIIRVSGENLKIAGDKGQIGVYIKEENGKQIKIEKENIIQNTPKMLMILLEKELKKSATYTLSIRTQYAAMGTSCTTSILREASKEFVWERGKEQKKKIKKCATKRNEKKYNDQQAKSVVFRRKKSTFSLCFAEDLCSQTSSSIETLALD